MSARLGTDLSEPDSRELRRRLSDLTSPVVPVPGGSLPSTAVEYLNAFCDDIIPAATRRWAGLIFCKQLSSSKGVVRHFKAHPNDLSRLGEILLRHGELEETRIVAGLVIRQALDKGVAFSACWPLEKVPDSLVPFPQEDGLAWMGSFQAFLDTLVDLKLVELTAHCGILYPIAILTSDGFKWRDYDAVTPVILIQDGKLTVFTADLEMHSFCFLDIHLDQIQHTGLRKSILHDSEERVTEQEPWEIVLSLGPGPATYCINESEASGNEVTLMFKHHEDAAECQENIAQSGGLFQSSDRGRVSSQLLVHPKRTTPVDKALARTEASAGDRAETTLHADIAVGLKAESKKILRKKRHMDDYLPLEDELGRRTKRRAVNDVHCMELGSPLESSGESSGSDYNTAKRKNRGPARNHATNLTQGNKNQPGKTSQAKSSRIKENAKANATSVSPVKHPFLNKLLSKSSHTSRGIDHSSPLPQKHRAGQVIKNGVAAQPHKVDRTDPPSEAQILERLNNDEMEMEKFTLTPPSSPRARRVQTHPMTPKGQTRTEDIFKARTSTAPLRVMEEPSSPCQDIKSQKALRSRTKIGTTNESGSPSHGGSIFALPDRPEGLKTPLHQTSQRTTSGSELLSSNSKPVPAAPNAESTAISFHASLAEVEMTQSPEARAIARSDPFRLKRKSGN